MTRLDSVIERARNLRVNRASAEHYIRDLHRHAALRGTVGNATGDSIGSYEIVRKIGEGGMGVVHLATHTILGRPAAVKVLLPELSRNRDMVDRFFNEARAAAAIRHPGIVDIYDFGFAADGSGYIAMELLEGETLRSRLRRQGRLSLESAIEIGRQIAGALQAAHDKGIVHRDLKPDNVFLVADPEIAERVKLLDFGIAKLAGDPGGPHTRTGTVLGTPLYMSPEQCRGADTLDGRSDLYSLGCILYELLAGRPVFPKESNNDVVAHHLYFTPEPVRQHEPAVPEPLDQLIDRLLCKDPGRRPSTAAEVAASLERCRTSASPPAVPGPMPPAAPLPDAAERTEQGASTTLSDAAGASTTLSDAVGVVRRTGAVTLAPRRSKRTLWFASAAAIAAAAALVTTIAVTAPPRVQPSRPAPAAPPAMPAVPSDQPAPSQLPPDAAPPAPAATLAPPASAAPPAPAPTATPAPPASAVPAALPPAATPPASQRPAVPRRVTGRSPTQPPRPAKAASEPAPVPPAIPPQAPAQTSEPAPAPAVEPRGPAPAHPAVPQPAADEDPLERP